MSSTGSPVALITAGSAGLGAAAARLFVKDGYRVIVNYNNNEDRARNLLDELKLLSPLPSQELNFKVLRADLGNRDQVIDMVKNAVAIWGRLDVVFSNGGWTRFTDFTDLDDNVVEEDWDKCFNMNVKSHLFLIHAAKEHLDKQHGAFITTASLAGVKAMGSSLAYSVTKAAQIHLVKGLAIAAGSNIRVNSVSPGLMLTEWGQKFSEEQRTRLKAQTLLKRFATIEDVAEQVLCFAKSKSTTGANVVIDAGTSI